MPLELKIADFGLRIDDAIIPKSEIRNPQSHKIETCSPHLHTDTGVAATDVRERRWNF